METERLVIEVACIAAILLMTVALQIFSNFSAVFPEMGKSSVFQMFAFAGIPVIFYCISRILFTNWISLTNRIIGDENGSKLPAFLQGYVGWLRILSALFIMYLGILLAQVLFPGIRQIALDTYNNYLGELPMMIWEETVGEREKALERGKRVLILITAWFSFFFVFELLIRGVLYGVKMILRLVLKGKMGPKHDGGGSNDQVNAEVDTKATEACTPPDSDDEPENK